MDRYKKLTLLHSNDMHGDFLSEMLKDAYVSRTCVCEESCNEYGLSNLGVAALCLELGICVCLE